MHIEPASIATLTMKIEIQASPKEVWRALTENIGQWWPADFYGGGEDGKRSYELEAFPGGRMFETWDGGGGLLWGNIVTVDPNKRLEVLGAVFPSFGGPTEWFGSWDLAETTTGRTTVSFIESSIGRLTEAGGADRDKGWTFLWNCMKAHIEGNPEPAWPN